MLKKRLSLKTVEVAYDALAEGYDSLFTSAVDAAENEALSRLLKDKVQGAVLDIGCGTGLLLDLLNIDTTHYLGVDISHGMIDVARRKHPHHQFRHADAEDLSELPDESFDVAVSLFSCLSYTPKPRSVISECHRVLRPGGRVILMVYGPKRAERHHGVHCTPSAPPSYRAFTARQMRNAMDGGLFRPTVRGFSSAATDNMNCEISEWANALLSDCHTRLSEQPDEGFFLLAEGVKG